MAYYIILSIAAVLFSSIIPIIGTDVWYPQFVTLLLVGGIGYSIYLYKWNKILASFAAYLAFSVVFISKQEPAAIICLLQVYMSLLICKYISELSRKDCKLIWKFLCLVFFVQLFWGILQKFGLDPIFHLKGNPLIDDTVGFSGSHNQYGLNIASLSPSLMVLGYTMFPIAFIGILLSQTLTAFLGLGISSWILCTYKFRFNFMSNLAFFLIGLLLFLFIVKKPVTEKFRERFDLWKLSVEQVNDGKALMVIDKNSYLMKTCNPLFGFGFESFMRISPRTQVGKVIKGKVGENIPAHRYEHAHNDYVEVFFDFGLIGIVMLSFFIWDLIYKFFSVLPTKLLLMSTSSLLSYGICALGIYTVHTAASGYFFIVFLGLFYSEVNNGKKRASR